MREIYAFVWRAYWDCLLDEELLVLTRALYHYRVPSNSMISALKRMEVEF